ncbi:MAG: helix-turn-helix transcriptional regulator [Planctomycetaceae bacterium]
MKVHFRLAEVLAGLGVIDRGRILRLAKETGIERHKMSRLIENSEAKVGLDDLAAICRYLIDVHGVDARDLPGMLFELEPSRFLSLLRTRTSLSTCFGVRQFALDPDIRWTSGADTYLHGRLLETLLKPEFASQPIGGEERSPNGSPERLTYSTLRQFHQEQVRAVTGPIREGDERLSESAAVLREDAERVARLMRDPRPSDVAGVGETAPAVDHAAIMLGSVKSNPVCELTVARIFNAIPWQRHGRARDAAESDTALVQRPADRAVPFFLRYRDDRHRELADAQFHSCHAGLRLAEGPVNCGDNSTTAGIYYELDSGEWECIPSSTTRDAAVVLYEFDTRHRNMEVVMGGFSSDATLALAMHLETIADRLYEGHYQDAERIVGVYVIDLHFTARTRTAPAMAGVSQLPELTQPPEVIPLSSEVIARRLKRVE